MSDERFDLSAERPKRSLWQKIVDVALMDVNTIVEGGIDAETVERLERVLLEADFGVDATMELVDELERAAERGRIKNEAELRAFLGERIRAILLGAATGDGGPATGADSRAAADAASTTGSATGARPPGHPGSTDRQTDARADTAAEKSSGSWWRALGFAGREAGSGQERAKTSGRSEPPPLRRAAAGPSIVLVVGVNGTGKTTTVAKLAWQLRQAGDRVLVAATDTFRAGAQEQLRQWAERVDAEFVGGKPGGDPAAVAFDAVEAARTRDIDWVLVDTAGRLHTQGDLMAELAKVDRVVSRKVEGAPHERLLVVDATSGQNVLAQAATFGSALELTGLVLAKFDSTARAGTAVAVAREHAIPVRFLGTGEGVDDLEPFDPDVYVEKVLGVA